MFRKKKEINKDSPTYIDLFSGAGGFSLGFDRMGFKIFFL